MTDTGPVPRRLYRGSRWWFGMVWFDAVGLLTMSAVFAKGSALNRLLPFVAGFGFVIYGTLVMSRIGVESGPDSILLHGPTGKRRVAYEDVDHFSVVDRWPYAPLLVLSGGGIVKTYGLGAGFPRHRQSFAITERVVAELNALVEARRRRPS